jgi:hypothetical protein
MQSLAVFMGQIMLLYFLSQLIQVRLSLWLNSTLSSQRLVVWGMAIINLPGTLIHELAHLIVARLLLVRAYGLTLIPKAGHGHIVMGSVQVPRTDVLRSFIIGIAPVLVGLAAIFGLMWAMEAYNLWPSWTWRILAGIALFQIGNNMFSSSADMQDAGKLFILIAIIVALLYWMGWRPEWDWVEPLILQHQQYLQQATTWLWPTVWINIIIALLIWRHHLLQGIKQVIWG